VSYGFAEHSDYAGISKRARARLPKQALAVSTGTKHLKNWLDDGYHGEMEYMARHGTRRSRPEELEPGTQRVISVRMDYMPPGTEHAWDVINDAEAGYVARYALGRDYHKLMRNRLQKLAERIRGSIGDFGYRAYVDSAPVLEKALARNAGLGWIGKHTVLINKQAGSYFFLGELYTNLPLPIDEPASAHCGTCRNASISVRRKRSSVRIDSMRVAAFLISRSS
jgi:epoxyqueuosine reductase